MQCNIAILTASDTPPTVAVLPDMVAVAAYTAEGGGGMYAGGRLIVTVDLAALEINVPRGILLGFEMDAFPALEPVEESAAVEFLATATGAMIFSTSFMAGFPAPTDSTTSTVTFGGGTEG